MNSEKVIRFGQQGVGMMVIVRTKRSFLPADTVHNMKMNTIGCLAFMERDYRFVRHAEFNSALIGGKRVMNVQLLGIDFGATSIAKHNYLIILLFFFWYYITKQKSVILE